MDELEQAARRQDRNAEIARDTFEPKRAEYEMRIQALVEENARLRGLVKELAEVLGQHPDYKIRCVAIPFEVASVLHAKLTAEAKPEAPATDTGCDDDNSPLMAALSAMPNGGRDFIAKEFPEFPAPVTECAARKALERISPYFNHGCHLHLPDGSVFHPSDVDAALATPCECAELREDVEQADRDRQDMWAEIIKLRAELQMAERAWALDRNTISELNRQLAAANERAEAEHQQ